LANEKEANHQRQVAEAKAQREQVLRLAQEEEEKAERKIQSFFSKLEL